MRLFIIGCLTACCVLPAVENFAAAEQPERTSEQNSKWFSAAPREEIRPLLTQHENGTLQIAADDRHGLNGWWHTTRPVMPGSTIEFSVQRQTNGIPAEEIRRAVPVRLLWQNDAGAPVIRDKPVWSSYRAGQKPRAEPEFPADQETRDGWTTVVGTYQVPANARQVRIELHFRWAPPGASVKWKDVRLQSRSQQTPRIVKLAAIHHRPREGKTPAEKREQFEPLIRQAAENGADLIVLPECLTFYGTGLTYADCAEPIPGPSTNYFAKLARQYKTHIVAGLLERDQHLIYNVAALLGPDGKLIGHYRKVTLPRGEIEGGITPGHEYPVFDTRFGKVGLMICYDGFFPEVARELSNNGAEVIAWPVWGCNPMLGAARACENHVFVVSSTYTDVSSDWMITGIYGRDGQVLSKAEDWGTTAMVEVDLNQPLYWHSLGDFKAQIQRHRPLVPTVTSDPASDLTAKPSPASN